MSTKHLVKLLAVALLFAAPAHAAVVLESFSALTGDPTGNVTVPVPSGTVDGNLLVMFFVADDENSITASGWNVLTEATGNNGAAAFRGTVLWKYASSEGANVTFTHTGNATTGRMLRFSGMATSNPFGATPDATFNGQASSTAVTGTSVTPEADGAMIVLACLSDGENNTVASYTGGSLTWTEAFDSGDAVTTFKSFALATAPQTTAAAIAPSATMNNAAIHNTHVLAILPASGGGGGTVVNPISGGGGAAARPVTLH